MEDALKSALIPVFALILASSCSILNRDRAMVGEDNNRSSPSKTVPRAQYDNLLVKYEELSKKYEKLKENPPKNRSDLIDDLEKSSTENFHQSSSSSNIETVDAFAVEESVSPVVVSSDVESQLSLYRKGLALKKTNIGEATKIFQQLEANAVPAVKVRAKLQIGEILYTKGQYDLALQVFEDIITKHAHSGVVLEALKYAQVCNEKLGIHNKKDQYASMLNDVFEAK